MAKNRPTHPGTTPVTHTGGGGNNNNNPNKKKKKPPHLNLPAPGVLGNANMTPGGWGKAGKKKKKAVQQSYAQFLATQAAANGTTPAPPVTTPGPLDNQSLQDKAKALDQNQQAEQLRNAAGLIRNQRNALGAGFYQGGATDFDAWQNEAGGYLDDVTNAALEAFNYNQLYADPNAAPTQAGVTPLNLPQGQFDQQAARRAYLNDPRAAQAGAQFFNPSGRWSWWD